MTEEEYREQITTLTDKMNKAYRRYRKLSDERRNLSESYCVSLESKYAEFIGKKVRIRFKHRLPSMRKEEGFLIGFNVSKISIDIYPTMAKINYDGSMSNRMVPIYATYDLIQDITLI